jgi:geranylgeranyldiphosphate transferase
MSEAQLMETLRWYCQLQNDCKNVFSSDVITAKGALAEDLANGEYSFPILVALYSAPPISNAVERALRQRGVSGSKKRTENAALMLQRGEVRDRCLEVLEKLREENKVFASLWGRQEEMSVNYKYSASKCWNDVPRFGNLGYFQKALHKMA